MNIKEKMRVTGIKLWLLLIGWTVGIIAAAGLFDIVVVMFHVNTAHAIPASWRFVTWPVAIISMAIWVIYSVKIMRSKY